MAWGKRTYSLKRDLLKSYVIVIVISIVVYCGLFVSRNQISEQMEHITDNNLKISQLSLLIPERQRQISPFSELEEEEERELLRLNRQIEEILAEIKDMCREPSDNYLVYSRILSQVNGHYEQYLKLYQAEEISSEMHYYTGNYLKSISEELGKYTNLLMSEYLNYSYVAFNQSMEQYKALELRINFAIILFIFACLIYMMFVSRRIWRFLSAVSDYTGHLSRQEWDVADMDGDRYSEFSMVAGALNAMKQEIKSHIAAMKEKNEIERRLQEEQLCNEKNQRMLREADLKMLQMQINPHFLFNTLNLIMRTVQLRDNQTAVELIKSTAQILRSSISIKSALIPLEEELRNIEAYLCIQRLRYQERITFETLYRLTGTGGLLVPPMILQPLVENAILHGLKDQKEGGVVRVEVTEDARAVEILVSDNGTGFSRRRLMEIEQETTDRIGLLNVKKRLCLQFPGEDVFVIESEENRGTRIQIRVPRGKETE